MLGFRNLVRAHFYGMPSGQAIAARLGLPAITPEALNLGPGFETGTPLWYYVLAESGIREFGQRLGPVASRINVEAFFSLLVNDPGSYLRSVVPFLPEQRIPASGRMTVSDLFAFAGVVP